jgi:ribonuclease P protein component
VQPRFGFTVNKRCGGAVRRNRIRRRLKEALRLLNPLPARLGYDYVIVARPDALDMGFPALQAELRRAFGRAGTLNSPKAQ